jgi:hypothetical protein
VLNSEEAAAEAATGPRCGGEENALPPPVPGDPEVAVVEPWLAKGSFDALGRGGKEENNK